MKPGFVVRTDIGVQPAWLALNPSRKTSWDAFDLTADPRRAHVFACAKDAGDQAWLWSDVPGVWRVLVRPVTLPSPETSGMGGSFSLRISGDRALLWVDGGNL